MQADWAETRTDWPSYIRNKPVTGTTLQYFRGDFSLGGIATPTALGLRFSQSVTTPSRAVVTSISATGFQISSTRDALACYEGSIVTTSSIGGGASGTVFLETADTNSTTPGDWTEVARQTGANTVALALTLQNINTQSWNLARIIPAGKFVRIRTLVNTGTVTFSINAAQQETLL